MHMQVSKCGGEDRAGLRHLPRLRDRQQKFVVPAICPIFRTGPVKKLRLGFVINEALIEWEHKKTKSFLLIETNVVQVLPNSFRIISRDRKLSIVSSARSKCGTALGGGLKCLGVDICLHARCECASIRI